MNEPLFAKQLYHVACFDLRRGIPLSVTGNGIVQAWYELANCQSNDAVRYWAIILRTDMSTATALHYELIALHTTHLTRSISRRSSLYRNNAEEGGRRGRQERYVWRGNWFGQDTVTLCFSHAGTTRCGAQRTDSAQTQASKNPPVKSCACFLGRGMTTDCSLQHCITDHTHAHTYGHRH